MVSAKHDCQGDGWDIVLTIPDPPEDDSSDSELSDDEEPASPFNRDIHVLPGDMLLER